MAMQVKVHVTGEHQVEDGAHILYFYSQDATYIDNAVSFIQCGMRLRQHVVYIDTPAKWNIVRNRFCEEFPNTVPEVLYINRDEFYRECSSFQWKDVLRNLKAAIHPFIQQKVPLRLWGAVGWLADQDDKAYLGAYECSCDASISELGFLTVCAYDANVLPATVLLMMMRSHAYLMTDDEMVRSMLYKHRLANPSYQFSALSAEHRLQSEVDLYKQKLDFVHVVSHEVRNPLTVIQSYAAMLLRDEQDPGRARKLRTILDYSDVIDHEISHILETEQMLASESIWNKRIVNPMPIVEEVLDIMSTKARTQNIDLNGYIRLEPSETCYGNRMSLKLIFSNVVSNAIKYSHEGSTIEVRCGREGTELVFHVIDYGVGMTEEQLSLLFRKYEKQHQESSGQGIGLFMVKTLVDSLDGEVSVNSIIGKGTHVMIRLPLL